MKTIVRHQVTPMPYSCRWCGVDSRGHGRRWVPGHSWHTWTEPTRAQIEARMRARHAHRQQNKEQA